MYSKKQDFFDIWYVRVSALEVVMQSKLYILPPPIYICAGWQRGDFASALSCSRENCLLDCTRRGKGSLTSKVSCDEASLALLAEERGRAEKGGSTLASRIS